MNATATKARPRSTNLGNGWFATPTGVKHTARGKVAAPGLAFGRMTKGEARKLRKALRRAGFARHAAAPRLA